MFTRRIVLFAALCLMTFAPLIGCQRNPATGRSQFIMISRDAARAIGSQAQDELINEYGGPVASNELSLYVSGIGEKLAGQTADAYSDESWTFVTVDSDVINAFALPNGTVTITRGLLEQFENEAQLAGVLGHEIGHVTGRHIDEAITQQTATSVLLQAGAIAADSQYVTDVAGLFAQGYFLKFGRDQESEADRLGVRYMTKAGYDPSGMIQLLEVLAAASGGARQPEMLSTHPHPETRINRVSALIEKEYPGTVNNPAYTLGKDRFQQFAAPHLSAAARDLESIEAAAVHWCGVCRAEAAAAASDRDDT